MSKYTEIDSPIPGSKAYRRGECSIIVGRNLHGKQESFGALRWHLSISCRNRYPTWDEIRDARYEFVPDDCTMVMVLPPKADYVNVHPNCFHLHEIVEDI